MGNRQEIKENNIKIAKERLNSINREGEFNFIISDSKLSPTKKPNYNKKKLYKLSSSSPFTEESKFKMHYHKHSKYGFTK